MTPALSSEGFRRPIAWRPPWAAAPLPDRHIALADALAHDDDWSAIDSVIDTSGVTAADVRVRAKGPCRFLPAATRPGGASTGPLPPTPLPSRPLIFRRSSEGVDTIHVVAPTSKARDHGR